MKSRLIVSSFLTIALCLSLIAGSTFALFTSESKVNVAVTSAKVNVTASLEDDAITKNFGDADVTDAKVSSDDPSKITITNFAPKDSVTVAVKLTNDSSIAIKYRLSVVTSNDFDGALKVTSSPVVLDTWYSAKAGQTLGTDGFIYVTIEYLFKNGAMQTQESSEFTFIVEAVQANGVETRVENADELKQVFASNNATDKHPVTVILNNDIVITEPLEVKGNFVLDTNGKAMTTIAEGAEASSVKYPFVMADASSLTVDAMDNTSTIITGYKGLVEIPQNVSAVVKLDGGKYSGENTDVSEAGALVMIQGNSTKEGNSVKVNMTAVTLTAKGIQGFSSKDIKNTTASLTVERSTFTTDTVGILADSCKLIITDTKFETNATAIDVVKTRFASAERCEIIINNRSVGDNIAGVSVSKNAMINLKHLSITAPASIPAYLVCDTKGEIIVEKSTANTDTVTRIDHADGKITIDGTVHTKK